MGFLKNYAYVEKATEENLNGKGIVWNLFKQWKPFVKYLGTDLIKDKETGKAKYTMDYVRCPKWIGDVIQRQLEWKTGDFSGKTYLLKRTEDKTTCEVQLDKVKEL